MERNNLYPLYVGVLYGTQISTCKSSKDLIVVVLEGNEVLCCFAWGQILQIKLGALQGSP